MSKSLIGRFYPSLSAFLCELWSERVEVALVLARIFASALFILLVGGPASAQDYPWEETVNLNNEPNACGAIMRALRKVNNGSDTNPVIRVQGRATITNADLHRHRYRNQTTGAIANAPFAYCAGLVPSDLFEEDSDYPIANGYNITNNMAGGTLYFDNVDITYDCNGQTVPNILIMFGDTWINGRESGVEDVYGGGVTQGPMIAGHLTLRNDSDCDTGQPTIGKPPERDLDDLFSSSTTTASVWMNGMQRTNLRNLQLTLVGRSSDNDDIGLLHDGLSVSSEWGYTAISRFAVGVLVAGKISSTFNGGYWSNNDFGLMIGDPMNAGDTVAAATCVAETDPSPGDCGVFGRAVSHPRFNNLIIEGNNYGEVAMFEGGTAVTFNSSHIEATSDVGHAFLVGAGICKGGDRDGMVGSTAADCPGGGTFARTDPYPVGSCAGAARSFTVLRFNGGYIPGDKGNVGTPDWGGLVIGNCANDSSSKIIIGGELNNSTVSGPLSVAFQFAPELSMPNMPQVDVTNVIRTGDFYWPAYANLFHTGAISIPFMVNAASWTTGQYISFGGDVTAGVAATSIFAGVPMPWAHLINYQVHHLDIGAFAAHTGNQTCNFVPVKMDYDHGTLSDVTGTTAAFTGNPITAGLRFAFNYTPGSSTVLSTASDHDKIGLRVENGSGCDELFASGALTLFPLE